MAEQVQVRGAAVKIRNPFLVFLWSLVTLGIYYVVWYYKINRELRDAAGVAVSPGVALLAVTLGWIVIVPPFVSWYRTFGRIVDQFYKALGGVLDLAPREARADIAKKSVAALNQLITGIGAADQLGSSVS